MEYLNNFKTNLLKELLTKFHRSKAFKTRDLSKNNIYLSVDDKFFDEYHNTKYKYLDFYNSILKELVNEELIIIKYDKDNDISRIYLNLKRVDKTYQILNIDNKLDKHLSLVDEVNELLKLSTNDISKGYLNDCLESLKTTKTETRYFKNSKDLHTIFKGIEEIYKNKDEILLRNFSSKIFLDSKYLESKYDYYLNIFNKYGMYDFKNSEEFISFFNIYKNPSHSFVKFGLTLKINNSIINLDDLNYDFSLTKEEIDNLKILNITKKKVITIENLTTYNYFNSKDYVVIYLSGYSDFEKIKLLTKIYEFNNNLEFYHFSDIDAGGFYIYLDLLKKTNINIKPYLMDLNTFNKYIGYGKELTKNDKMRLENILNSNNKEFKELIKEMLKTNKKLEQENIDLKEFK